MLVDAGTADRGLFDRTFDACVIGTGPAGMTVARKLAAQGYSVALMEGGGLDVTPQSQALYQGEIVGVDYDPLEIVRLREFGGSSGHWGGRCRELDTLNFGPLAQSPMGAWPIHKADLDLFAAEADAILELPPAEADAPLDQSVPRFHRARFRQSPPVRFGEKYQAEVAASTQIVCAYNANLLDMRLEEPGVGAVSEAVFRSFDPADPGFTVRARVFCLCLGGLENPRFLLNCVSQRPAGIGNENDLVGRYFCEHTNYHLGDVFFSHPFAEEAMEGEARNAFVSNREFIDRNGILSFALLVYPRVEDHLRLERELVRAAACAVPAVLPLASQLTGRDVDCDSGGLRNYFEQPAGKITSHGNIRIRAEQSLIRDSRVMLADATDAFGQRRIRFDWRVGDVDYRTLRLAILELGAHFAEQGTGRVRVIDWVLNGGDELPAVIPGQYVGGPHHMCTTRMASDPREGVVDANCRVHGLSNLYIGGSSVFSSPGYANPTYTIVQLALRLGDHLGSELRGSQHVAAKPVLSTEVH